MSKITPWIYLSESIKNVNKEPLKKQKRKYLISQKLPLEEILKKVLNMSILTPYKKKEPKYAICQNPLRKNKRNYFKCQKTIERI